MLAFFLFFLSIRFPVIKALLQFLSAALLFPVIQISNRFLFTEYRYGLEDGHLLLSSRQGKREKNLGGVPITADMRILDKTEWERDQTKYPLSSRFSYCQNLFPQDPHYLVAEEEKGYFLLIFEPDEVLLTLLNEEIKSREGEHHD